jgi:hypothetical protein
VPLATGFLWLVVLWLIFYQVIPSRAEATGIAAEAYRVVGAFGPAALAAAASFVAYLIGILVAPASETVVRALASRRMAVLQVSRSTDEEAFALARKTIEQALSADLNLSDLGAEWRRAYRENRPPTDWADPESGGVGESSLPSALVQISVRRMQAEVSQVATRLLADDRQQLFDRYDRAAAEAAFRFSISIPLVVVSCLIPVRIGSLWWGYVVSIGIGICVAVVLAVDGRRKYIASNDAIFQAVFVVPGLHFPTLENIQNLTHRKLEPSRGLTEKDRMLDSLDSSGRVAGRATRGSDGAVHE